MCVIGQGAPIGGVEACKWRLDSVSQRTILWYDTTNNGIIKQRNKKTYRNPIILAREMALMMEMEDLSRAELARKLGLSRARVTQMLNLMKLPENLISEIEEMGDYWIKQLVTERKIRAFPQEEYLNRCPKSQLFRKS